MKGRQQRPTSTPLDLDRESQLKQELDETLSEWKTGSFDESMFDDRSLLELDKEREEWWGNIFESLETKDKDKVNISRIQEANIPYSEVMQWVEDATCLVNQNEAVVKHLLAVIDKFKSEALLAQQKIIKLQDKLLDKKNEEINSFKQDCTQTVQETVKEEIRSFSEVLKSAPQTPAVCEEKLKLVVKSAIEEDDKGKNLIIHGLKEEEKEKLQSKVTPILEVLGASKAKVEVCRIGKKSTTKSVRPVKVVFASNSQARLVLSKAKQLKDTAAYKSVFLSPDRTLEERVAHQKLIIKLKEERARDKTSRHFIRNGKICSIAIT